MTKDELIEKMTPIYEYSQENGKILVIRNKDQGVSRAGEAILKAKGIAPGVQVRILKGRQKGLTGIVTTVDWHECQFQIKGHNCWFSLWFDTKYAEVI